MKLSIRKQKRRHLRKLSKERAAISAKTKELLDRSSKLDIEIIKLMNELKLKEFNFSKENKITTNQNSYTHYDTDYFRKLIRRKKFPKKLRERLITKKTSYFFNDTALAQLISDGKLKVKEVRKGISETKSKTFLRIGKADG